jgi:hypothetical protein
MAMEMVMRRMKVDATVHGFRSAFRDWAAEATEFPNEVAEMALAHAIPNGVERAYRRGSLLEKRRALIEAWAAFSEPGAAEVVRVGDRRCAAESYQQSNMSSAEGENAQVIAPLCKLLILKIFQASQRSRPVLCCRCWS